MEFGERTRDCTPGHAGKEGPHLTVTGGGGSRWFYRAVAPVLVSQEVRRGAQGAFRVAPGNSGLHAHGKAEEISSVSHSVVFLYFFAFIAEEDFLISPCYSLELCIQMGISYIFPG